MGRILLSGLLLGVIFYSNSQSYVDVASQWGVDHSYGVGLSGAGVSLVDFNDDGLDDLTLATKKGEEIYFYLNKGDHFEKIQLNIFDTTESKNLLWIDFDNDGDQDLYVSSLTSKNSLYRNNGQLQFEDVTKRVGLPDFDIYSWGVAWADYDKNGWLDLYITTRGSSRDGGRYNFLYKNDNGKFIEVTEGAGALDADKMPFCATFFDYNNDGWEDIYIVHDFHFRSVLLKNNADGTFDDVSEESKSDLKIGGMGIAIGDFDNNGYFDIYNSNESDGNKLLQNLGNGTFNEIAEEMGVGFYGWGWAVTFFDFDNDTDLDLYCTGGNIDHDYLNFNAFYRNDSGYFSIPETIGLIGDSILSYTHAVGDFNSDGYYDIVSNNHDENPSTLWQNTGSEFNWVKVKLKGTISNADAIGSRLEYFLGDKKHIRYTHVGEGFLGQNSRNLILGIKELNQLDSLHVIWPSGHTDKLYNLNAGEILEIEEGQYSDGFSCEIKLLSGTCNEYPRLSASLFGKGISYNWSNNSQSPVITVYNSGRYTLRTTTDQGVFVDTISINLEDLTVPMDLTMEVFPSTDLDGLATVNVSGGVPPYEFQWNDPFLQTTQTAINLSPGQYMVTVTDQRGCVQVGMANVGRREAILGDLLEEEISIFPNPANTALYYRLESFGVEEISITDISGKQILQIQQPPTVSGQINLHDIEKGIYLITLKGDNSKIVQKRIIIEK